MSQADLQNLHDYIEFKINYPDFKGCVHCRELQEDEAEPRDCERCSSKFGPKGIIELTLENQDAWELAEKIYYLGAELAIALRGGLKLTQDEAYWLSEKLVAIMGYFKYLEMKNSPKIF